MLNPNESNPIPLPLFRTALMTCAMMDHFSRLRLNGLNQIYNWCMLSLFIFLVFYYTICMLLVNVLVFYSVLLSVCLLCSTLAVK